jgi:RNA polymerase sigma-70 factor (ECF subfamily)
MKICRLYFRDPEDINDLRQDILFHAWRAFGQFRGDSKFSTWLYKIALNTAITKVRKKRIDSTSLLESHHAVADLPGDKQQKTDLLMKLIANLNDQEKALIALYLDELSYEEIAEITGLSLTNVGVRLNRIKQKLKKISAHED